MKQFEGHTPGPWKLTREGTSMPEDKNSPTLIVVDTKTNHAISEVRWTHDRYSHAPMLKAARANAALIASAPELLKERDALKDALLNLKMVFEGLALTHKAPETMKMVNAALTL